MEKKKFEVPKDLNLSEEDARGLEALAKHFDEQFEQHQKGLLDGEDLSDKIQKAFDNYTTEYGINKETFTKMEKALKEHGVTIKELKANPKGNVNQFEEEIKSAFEQLKENKGKGFEVAIKAAGPVMTTNVPAMGLRYEIEPGINRLDSKEPIMYDSFLKGQTNAKVIHWINQKPKEGGSAFIGEGQLKPLKDWEYEEENSNAKKIAVRSKHSEEIFDDFDDFMSEVRTILTDDLVSERETQLLLGDGSGQNPKGVVADASAYIASGGVNGKVIMPNLADVIVAMALQIKVVGKGRADIAVLNSYDHAILKLTKTQQGNYLTPELQALLAGIKIVESDDMPAGKILVADSRKHKVKNKKGILMKTIYENDDMSKNMVGFVVEQFLFSYRSTIHNASFVYDDIATVKAALVETPVVTP